MPDANIRSIHTLVQDNRSNPDPMTHSIIVTEDEIRPGSSVFI